MAAQPQDTTSFTDAEFARLALRRADYSLSDTQEALRGAYRDFFAEHAPIATVRAAEPGGFDHGLWQRVCAMRTLTMGVPAADGGDGAGLVELALVAEEYGASLAPAPLVDGIVAARLLAGRSAPDVVACAEALDRGDGAIAFVPYPVAAGSDVFVAHGGAAATALALVGDELVLAPVPHEGRRLANLGSLPLVRTAIGGSGDVVVARGTDAVGQFGVARREWLLLSAAALVGVARACVDIGVSYARERHAFGVPIGFFQSIAHPLADAAIGVECGRRLVHKAAWFADHEPGRPELAPASFVHAQATAVSAAGHALHVLGGVGYTMETDVQLYYRRAQAWAAMGGDPERLLDDVAAAVLGPLTVA